MGLSLQDDVLLVTSNDPANRNFGTGFAVHRDHEYTYVITCAHVIRDVGGAGQVQVADTAAEVIGLGSEDGIEGIDLAVVRVPSRDLIKELNHAIALLSLRTYATKGSSFTTAGFKSTLKKSYASRTLYGNLGESINVGASQSTLTQAWDLLIDGDFPLEPGYSGSPVVDVHHHTVIGVAATIQDGGRKGVAISIAALAKVWPEMPAALLQTRPPRDPLTELRLLLQQANIARATVKAAYDRCVPEDLTGLNVWSFPGIDEYGPLIAKVVEQLDDVVEKEQGIPPILAFAIHLSQSLPADKQMVQDQLQRWITTSIEMMQVDPQLVRTFQMKTRMTTQDAMAVTCENRIALDPSQTVCGTPTQEHTASSPPGYMQSLLVRLKRDPQSNKSYFVQAWLRDNETTEHKPLPLTAGLDQGVFDKAYPVSRLRGLLTQFLTDIAEYDDLEKREVRQPDIELFVPCELFDEKFDTWTIDNGLPWGMRYQLVIRSSERQTVNNTFWMNKCKVLQEHKSTRYTRYIHWIHDTDTYGKTNVCMKIAAHLAETEIVCMGMMVAPAHFATLRTKKELFRTLVISGIPVAFWPRQLPTDPQKLLELKEKIKRLFDSYELRSLPQMARDLRLDALKEDDPYHLGRHLTLFWDEWKHRLPPDEPRLQATKKRSS